MSREFSGTGTVVIDGVAPELYEQAMQSLARQQEYNAHLRASILQNNATIAELKRQIAHLKRLEAKVNISPFFDDAFRP